MIVEAIDRNTLTPFQEMQWRIANCFVRVYDRKQVDVYGDNFLHYLYQQTVDSGPNVLSTTFCGVRDLTADAICAYLHTRQPLLLLCMDSDNDPARFDAVGYLFPTVWFGIKGETERSGLIGYCFFHSVWGTPQASVLGMLALAYMFLNYDLVAIHGQSAVWNQLSHKFVEQFGVRETGILPRTLPRSDGQLEDCRWSTVLREDFEKYAREQLLSIQSVTP